MFTRWDVNQTGYITHAEFYDQVSEMTLADDDWDELTKTQQEPGRFHYPDTVVLSLSSADIQAQKERVQEQMCGLKVTAFDVNNDGMIMYEEFQNFWTQVKVHERVVQEIFREMDVHQTGFISHSEYHSYIRKISVTPPPTQSTKKPNFSSTKLTTIAEPSSTPPAVRSRRMQAFLSAKPVRDSIGVSRQRISKKHFKLGKRLRSKNSSRTDLERKLTTVDATVLDNGRGRITSRAFKSYFSEFTNDVIAATFRRLDRQKSGYATISEFEDFVGKLLRESTSQAALERQSKNDAAAPKQARKETRRGERKLRQEILEVDIGMLDRNGDGRIHYHEFRNYFSKFEDPVLRSVFTRMDRHHSGFITIAEFYDFVEKIEV